MTGSEEARELPQPAHRTPFHLGNPPVSEHWHHWLRDEAAVVKHWLPTSPACWKCLHHHTQALLQLCLCALCNLSCKVRPCVWKDWRCFPPGMLCSTESCGQFRGGWGCLTPQTEPFFQCQGSGAPGPAHINSWEAQEERRMRRCLSSFRQTRAVAADFVKTFRGILQYSTEMKNFYSIILDIWSINTHRFPQNSHGGVKMS